MQLQHIELFFNLSVFICLLPLYNSFLVSFLQHLYVHNFSSLKWYLISHFPSFSLVWGIFCNSFFSYFYLIYSLGNIVIHLMWFFRLMLSCSLKMEILFAFRNPLRLKVVNNAATLTSPRFLTMCTTARYAYYHLWDIGSIFLVVMFMHLDIIYWMVDSSSNENLKS